jgi:hypothetical protein
LCAATGQMLLPRLNRWPCRTRMGVVPVPAVAASKIVTHQYHVVRSNRLALSGGGTSRLVDTRHTPHCRFGCMVGYATSQDVFRASLLVGTGGLKTPARLPRGRPSRRKARTRRCQASTSDSVAFGLGSAVTRRPDLCQVRDLELGARRLFQSLSRMVPERNAPPLLGESAAACQRPPQLRDVRLEHAEFQWRWRLGRGIDEYGVSAALEDPKAAPFLNSTRRTSLLQLYVRSLVGKNEEGI